MAYSLTYFYRQTSKTYSVSGASNITTDDGVVIIPSTYNDGTNGEHPVTDIRAEAFKNCYGLTSVTIPDSVTSIGSSAFSGCSGLKSITIPFVGATKDGTSNAHFGYIFGASSNTNNSAHVPSSLKTVVITGGTRIGDWAFNDCSSLTSVTIGNSVTSIGNHAFNSCSSLTSITIPNGVTSIKVRAFNGCSSLTSITIPNSVTSIGDFAFNGCTNLKQLILFPSTPPSLVSNSIPTTVQTIYVQQSSKAAYQSAANWSAFASKIVSDNLYLSFVRFNQKNKEYIDVVRKDTSAANPSSNIKIYKLEQNLSISPSSEKNFSNIAYTMSAGKKYHIDLFVDCNISDSNTIMSSQINIKRGSEVLLHSICRTTLNSGGGVMCSFSYDNTSGNGTEIIYPSSYNYTSSSTTFRATLYIMEIN